MHQSADPWFRFQLPQLNSLPAAKIYIKGISKPPIRNPKFHKAGLRLIQKEKQIHGVSESVMQETAAVAVVAGNVVAAAD